jgi:hypothetical protein
MVANIGCDIQHLERRLGCVGRRSFHRMPMAPFVGWRGRMERPSSPSVQFTAEIEMR